MAKRRWFVILIVTLLAASAWLLSRGAPEDQQSMVLLPSSKVLLAPLPGEPQRTNSFPTTLALSPDGRYLAALNGGYGTGVPDYDQSIAVLDLMSGRLADFPDARLSKKSRQSYFLGLAFSGDGQHLYASIGSLTDPEGHAPEDTGNGIAVYRFGDGKPTPERFIKIGLQPLAAGHETRVSRAAPPDRGVPYPAGITVVEAQGHERLLVADNLSDDALLLDAATGDVIFRYDLSTDAAVPASYPYGVVAMRDGHRGYCSLWNASEAAELDLQTGRVTRMIPLLKPASAIAAGSHPTALLLSPDARRLYVALANADRVAVVDTATGRVTGMLSTTLPGERRGGTYPNALAENADGSRLFVADAAADAVAVFDMKKALFPAPTAAPAPALGFIPTEWYPTALAVQGDSLFVATGKGQGTGPNANVVPTSDEPGHHPYIATLIHGSIARINLPKAESRLAALTEQTVESNRMRTEAQPIQFRGGANPIRHVIYIIKENRSYDQILGDLGVGNGDPSLTLYGADITPNEHALARQFGVLDNFYDSGEVSGDGHVWSTAAITSDYNEKTWEVGYRGQERLYDYEGEVALGFPIEQGIADVDEPGTGYLWAAADRAGVTHRNYAEFVATEWCNELAHAENPRAGTPPAPSVACPKEFIEHGQPLPSNVGQPHGSPSPWPWAVPIIARDVPTKPELRGHFDPRFADFNLYYPDQLRADEFLDEFAGFVSAREKHEGTELPQFVILRLPNDHTIGTRPGGPQPAASVADNDLAVGRVVDAVSHSPYWDDTALFILEDDAQNGADHVDAHRSIAFVVSKYSPGSADHPFVDSHFYTTVNLIRTMEMLLAIPPMNNNDAWAAPMAPLFTGVGNQPPYNADDRNRSDGLIYRVNPPHAPGARESSRMDFSHADAVDTATLNAILWRDRKGNVSMPAPRHTVIPEGDE
jgi:DNA-binding beta-propeller fold protein YncE